jgi:hypothetical protein
MSEQAEENQISTDQNNNKPKLTLRDLTLMAEIIQECTSRGVWRVSELSSVGLLYDRLETFLSAAGISLNKDTKH